MEKEAFFLIRTDLAAEFAANATHEGVTITHRNLPYPVTDVRILTEDAAKRIGKPCGRYFTVEELNFAAPMENFEHSISVISALLRELMPKGVKCALIVGLGNRDITPDALGPQAVKQVLVTRHIGTDIPGMNELCSTAAIAPGVLGQTGIEIADLVQALCRQILPDLLIVVDALAAAQKERLCTSLQLSDTGIVPGSGVMNHRHALDERTLGIPVIAVGVPTVIALEDSPKRFVTPREVDLCIEHSAKFIGQIINTALHPSLSLSELLAFTG